MLGETHYLLRSQADGKYLVAQPEGGNEGGYLLLFKENFDARTYLNQYAPDLCDRLTIEAATSSQIKGILQRWGYGGVAVVEDPLAASLQFLDIA